MASLQGRLLVAAPTLLDPNFSRTVVLVLHHDDQGALGLVLDRPSETPLAVALPAWADVADTPAVVHVGGPVEPTSVIGLARGTFTDAQTAAPLYDDLATIDLGREPGTLDADLWSLRVFAGHAGWGAGQLDAELEAGGWIVADAHADDAFDADPAGLWRRVLARQRGRVAWLVHCPTDPSTN